MAMQTGIGVSKILILAGAGWTGAIFLNNGKLSDLLAELHLLVKGLEKFGDQSDGESDITDAIASQVGRLAYEIGQLASLNRSITVVNESSGQTGNILSLVAPAAALSTLGYGYIWWKGLSLSNFMYATKGSMEKAVLELKKRLQHASDVIANAKKYLTQRIQHLDDKMVKQNELARSIKDEVTEVRNTITNFREELGIVLQEVQQLGVRLSSLGWNQDYTIHGIEYLINVVKGNSRKMHLLLQQEQLKLSGKSGESQEVSDEEDDLSPPQNLVLQRSGALPHKTTVCLSHTDPRAHNIFPNTGLKDIAGTLSTGLDRSASDVVIQNSMDKLERHWRPMLRATSIRCL